MWAITLFTPRNHAHRFGKSYRHNPITSNYRRKRTIQPFHLSTSFHVQSKHVIAQLLVKPNTQMSELCYSQFGILFYYGFFLLQIPVAAVQSKRQIVAFYCKWYHHSSMLCSSSHCHNSPVHNPLASTEWVRTTALSLLSVFTQLNQFLKQTRRLHTKPETLFPLPNQNSPFFRLLSFRNALFSC